MNSVWTGLCTECKLSESEVVKFNYMLKDKVWFDRCKKEEILCFDCCNKRFNLHLWENDFKTLPINLEIALENKWYKLHADILNHTLFEQTMKIAILEKEIKELKKVLMG